MNSGARGHVAKVLDMRSKGLWFDSRSNGLVQKPCASFESKPSGHPVVMDTRWNKNWYCLNGFCSKTYDNSPKGNETERVSSNIWG